MSWIKRLEYLFEHSYIATEGGTEGVNDGVDPCRLGAAWACQPTVPRPRLERGASQAVLHGALPLLWIILFDRVRLKAFNCLKEAKSDVGPPPRKKLY